ncbi:hypothetical protein CU668_28115, partial [Pseudomonas syringae pv. actinidifoliorum]|nr:hypothetical protein [Pseudomonas syringae pv. actinidifoliorum]
SAHAGHTRSGLVREGLRSGPETGHLGCVWHTEAADFTAGSRQFADKRSVARSAPVACGRKSFYGPSGLVYKHEHSGVRAHFMTLCSFARFCYRLDCCSQFARSTTSASLMLCPRPSYP